MTGGVLAAVEDESIWTKTEYENFELDLDFKTDVGTNSGVVVYCTDTKDWIPNSVEIQIADDHCENGETANLMKSAEPFTATWVQNKTK